MTTEFPLILSGNRRLLTDEFSDWIAGRAIRLFGLRIGLQTNQPALLERLDNHLPPLWQSTSDSTVDCIYSLRTSKNNHAVFENGVPGLKARSLARVLEDFERRLKMYVAEMARRRVFVHAGAVGWQGSAILIPGRSYSGKTTLVRELVRAGATYYSDEYAVLDLQGRLHPYPQPLAIRQDGSYTQKKHPVETLGGVVGSKPLPIKLVLVSQYRDNARWQPLQLTAGHGILALLDNTVPARRKPEVVLPVLQKAVAAATILKGDRSEATAMVNRILEQYA
jgi:hypothetical protein